MEHTHGKWEIVNDDGVLDILANKQQTIATIIDAGCETKANAHLIAAAPDLLGACKDTLEQAGISTNSPTYKKLERAIAKAKE